MSDEGCKSGVTIEKNLTMRAIQRSVRGLSSSAGALDSGRFCPPYYGYGAKKLAACATDEADTLLVAGGVYGNLEALDAIERRYQQERAELGAGGRVRVVFNGDFNFFNATPDAWNAVNRRIYAAAPDGWSASLGNVEFEAAQLGGSELAGGCGCAYPENVSDETVSRSNQIVQLLVRAAAEAPSWSREWLGGLQMYAACRVGGARVSIVHGDPQVLAGWSLSAESVDDAQVRGWLADADADVFASTHTCMAHAREIARDGDARGSGAVFNSGAAGIPNFAGEQRGVLTRVSTNWTRAPADSLFAVVCASRGIRIDAVPVAYDVDAWRRRWEAWWPAGSAARLSYAERMANGLRGWTLEDAYRRGSRASPELSSGTAPAVAQQLQADAAAVAGSAGSSGPSGCFSPAQTQTRRRQ